MASAPVEWREIPYLRLFPWVRLFRAVRLALDAKKLILAAIGVGLMQVGWGLFDRAFPTAEPLISGPGTVPLPNVFDSVRPLRQTVGEAASRLTDPALAFVQPFLGLFSVPPAPGEFWHALLSALWAVVVWGLVGGAIARIAVVQVASAERVPISQAVLYALRHSAALVSAPITPFLGVVFFAVPCALLGMGYQLRNGFALAALGVFAFLPLLAGVAMTIILTGVAAGWPLMHSAIAAEGEDAFDAISRSYAYVFERPARYAAYTALAWLLGILGVLLVGVLARMVIGLALWGLSFGAPDSLLVALFQGEERSAASMIHSGWYTVFWTLAYGWVYSYFWTSMSIIYLLLRHDIDGTDWHDLGANAPRRASTRGGKGTAHGPAREEAVVGSETAQVQPAPPESAAPASA
jgi:hypothetical protein